MIEIRCSNCNRLLFKAYSANLETVCGKCGRLIKINISTQSGEVLKVSGQNEVEDSKRN